MVGRITLFQLRHSKSPNSEDSDLCHYCPVGQNSPPGPLQRAAAGWAQTPDCMRGGEDTEGGGSRLLASTLAIDTAASTEPTFCTSTSLDFRHGGSHWHSWIVSTISVIYSTCCVESSAFLCLRTGDLTCGEWCRCVSGGWSRHSGGELQHSSCFRVLTITCEVA